MAGLSKKYKANTTNKVEMKKGLEFLYDKNEPENTVSENSSLKDKVIFVDISKVKPAKSAVNIVDENSFKELVEAEKISGQLVIPIIVRKKQDYYEIIAGARRWRAAKLAGHTKVPVIIRK